MSELYTGDAAEVDDRSPRWLPFEEAREWVWSLGLKKQREWNQWCRSGQRRTDIPTNPHVVYRDRGWNGYGDWLGTGRTTWTRKRIWRPFTEARALARGLGLSNSLEWDAWAKSDARPADVPSAADQAYRSDGWAGWGDFLGTGNIRPKDRSWRSFEESRALERTLDLVGSDGWADWCKTAARPDDIPVDPATVYEDEGWAGWGDFLGTGRVHWSAISYRPFGDAREFARGLGLGGKDAWVSWAKTSDRPADIPANPPPIYRKDWIGWRDWLGIGIDNLSGFRDFREARSFGRSLELKSATEWRLWVEANDLPTRIPSQPDKVYKGHGWNGWADFLGSQESEPSDRTFVSFDEAKAFAKGLGIKNFTEWARWSSSGERPPQIPSNPNFIYKHEGWSGWGNFLATGSKRPQDHVFRSYEETKAFTRGLNFKNMEDWRRWALSGDRPEDIPSDPQKTYTGRGWINWYDFLGVVNQWKKNSILNFLRGLRDVLTSLSSSELLLVLRQSGITTTAQSRRSKLHSILKELHEVATVEREKRPAVIDSIVARLEDTEEESKECIDEANGSDHEQELPTDLDATEVERGQPEATRLPELGGPEDLKAPDRLIERLRDIGVSMDEEAVEFLVCNRVAMLWQAVIDGRRDLDVELIRNDPEPGRFYCEIRSRFLPQYDGATALALPCGWRSTHTPNLMQKLCAYRVAADRRIGNFSGTGAGKTLSAILAAMTTEAELTVIVVANATAERWGDVIQEAHPAASVLVKQTELGRLLVDRPTYIVLNYERFSQPESRHLVGDLLQHPIALVVLDEVHLAKKRTKEESKRRRLITHLLEKAGESNPGLRVLGMSATPVLNSLTEGKALLELITGQVYDDIRTTATQTNAHALHQHLVIHGLRWRPKYEVKAPVRAISIDGSAILESLDDLRGGDILRVEQIMLGPKLDVIAAECRPGTLVYSQYVEGMVDRLGEAISRRGLRVGRFTGEHKGGLQSFLDGQIDVLVASQPISLGVDGLQRVSDKLVVASLPWTGAAWEQLVGRLVRQGSNFEEVEVVVPEVVLPGRARDGSDWSWDRRRMDRIKYKMTLADAALDGVQALGDLGPPEQLSFRALGALDLWTQRIEAEGPFVFERERLVIPLPTEAAAVALRRYGELSALHARFNRKRAEGTHSFFQVETQAWFHYHTLYRAARSKWEIDPCVVIADSLRGCVGWAIGDFGCGEARLSAMLPENAVTSVDHVAIDERVIACDMRRTPIEAGSLDAVVFCLSLWGPEEDVAAYVAEANRVLVRRGELRIAEPASRWDDNEQSLVALIELGGFKLIGAIERRGKFMFIEAIRCD
jgi:Hypothetical methyltransferase